MATESIAKLSATITADVQSFSVGMKRAEEDLASFIQRTKAVRTTPLSTDIAPFRRSIEEAREHWGGLLSLVNRGIPWIAAGAGLGGAMQWAASTAESMRQLAIQAEDLGMGMEGIQRLRHLGAEVGTPFEAIAVNMKRLNQRIGEMQLGSREAAEAFKRLGLSAKDFEGLDLEERFLKVATALAAIHDQGVKAAMIKEIFGRGGTQIDTLIERIGQGQRGYALTSERHAEAWAGVGRGVWRAKDYLAAPWMAIGGELIAGLRDSMANPISRWLGGDGSRPSTEQVARQRLQAEMESERILARQREHLEAQQQRERDLVSLARQRKAIQEAIIRDAEQHFRAERDRIKEREREAQGRPPGDVYYEREMERIRKLREAEGHQPVGITGLSPADIKRKKEGGLTLAEMEEQAARERDRLNQEYEHRRQQEAQRQWDELHRKNEIPAALEALKTGEEKYAEQMRLYADWFEHGMIQEKDFRRLKAHATEEFLQARGADTPRLATGARRDTVEAYRQIVEAQARLSQRDMELAELRRLAAIGERICREIEGMETPETARLL